MGNFVGNTRLPLQKKTAIRRSHVVQAPMANRARKIQILRIVSPELDQSYDRLGDGMNIYRINLVMKILGDAFFGEEMLAIELEPPARRRFKLIPPRRGLHHLQGVKIVAGMKAVNPSLFRP